MEKLETFEDQELEGNTPKRKQIEPSPERESADQATPNATTLDSESGRVEIGAKAEEDQGRSPKKICLSSTESAVDDTSLDLTSDQKASMTSEQSNQTEDQPEPWPPLRIQTKLHKSDKDRPPRNPLNRRSGWRNQVFPPARDSHHPDWPFTMKDPYIEPEKELPGYVFTNDGFDFQPFLGTLGLRSAISQLENETWGWAHLYCASPEEIEARMTAQQKQDIMDFLGSWSLYNDWDTLVSTFPKPEFRFRTITQAVLLKDMFQSLFENPFYYMDVETHRDGRSDVLPPPYGKQLYQHWQKILRVDELGAERWRISTVHMMNKYLEPTLKTNPRVPKLRGPEADDPSAGIRSWNVRLRYVNQLTRNMLGRSSLLWPMLLEKDPEDKLHTDHPFHRHGEIRRVYEKASDTALHMWFSFKLTYRFDDDIKEASPYTKQGPHGVDFLAQKRWWACWANEHRDEPVGLPAVLIMFPIIWAVQYREITDTPAASYFIEDHFRKHGLTSKEWAYVDDSDWCYQVVSAGKAIYGKPGTVSPHAEDTHLSHE